MSVFKTGIKKKMENPYFWVGVGGVLIAASGVDATSLTSWSAAGAAFLSIVQNPIKLAAVVGALMGVFCNPLTSGLSD